MKDYRILKDYKPRRRHDDKTVKGEFFYMLACGAIICVVVWAAFLAI